DPRESLPRDHAPGDEAAGGRPLPDDARGLRLRRERANGGQSMSRVPVAEGIFTWPSDDPQLIGSRCSGCGIVTFPSQDSCPRCGRRGRADALLPRRGRLGAGPPQEFPPPPPPYAGPVGDAFVPYGVGYVQLGDDVKVETRLTQSSGLQIGMDMELVLLP